MLKLSWQCMFSPRLFKVYRDGPRESMYQPGGLEKWGDKIITTASAILTVSMYTSPLICMYVYKRGFFSVKEMKTMSRYLGGITCLLAFSFIIRSIGRATSPRYVAFVKSLATQMNDTKSYLETVRKYDFEFKYWPVSFSLPAKPTTWLDNPFKKCANPDLPLYQRGTLQILAYLATHTFGLRLIYPGSLWIVQHLLWNVLFQGRTVLVESHDGKRAKLGTADGNAIDTIFIDHRDRSPKGKILVICCEGNSGFYEIGIMTTPVKAGYSALGWNHPGFAGSTGYPYPEQEQNAIDAVMQYAINKLGFAPEQIVVFGWSIGGYAGAWAANNYPVKGLILDATFDDLLHLAINQMPSSWSLLVKEVVRSYVDLNICELVTSYTGPVQLVRRTEDEIICLRPGELSTNRCNDLLLRLLETRHPEVMTVNAEQDMPALMAKLVTYSDSQRATLDRADIGEAQRRPLQLINKYMKDYKSSHCTPLPEQFFDTLMQKITTG